eukprot:GDKI01033203.1.p1 GENE.GDKI01033203.1~~GDKI01033203.1.p1  ORF type:complete len:334 (-),score=58.94 GDKI01033203.1:217-1218(-)
MRSLCLLLFILHTIFLCLGVNAATQATHGSISFNTNSTNEQGENATKSRFYSHFRYEFIAGDEGGVLVGFELDNILNSLWSHNSPVLKHLPGYTAWTGEDKSYGMFARFKEKSLYQRTQLRSYTILILHNGSYTEQVGLANAGETYDRQTLRGGDAADALKTFYTDEALSPLFFIFRHAQRFATPAGLLPAVSRSIFDINNTKWKSETDYDPSWNPEPVKYRFFFMDVPNDSPARYTEKQLSKILTLPPTTHTPKYTQILEELAPYTQNIHQHTPIRSVVAQVQEEEKTDTLRLHLVYILFSATPHVLTYDAPAKCRNDTVMFYGTDFTTWKD